MINVLKLPLNRTLVNWTKWEGATNKFWECWSRQPLWNKMGITYLSSPQKTGHLNLTVMSKSCFIYYYYFLKIWLLVFGTCYKYSSHWDTTRSSSFDYWSKKAKPKVEPSTSIFSSPYSPNPYFNMEFFFFFFFDLFLVNVFFYIIIILYILLFLLYVNIHLQIETKFFALLILLSDVNNNNNNKPQLCNNLEKNTFLFLTFWIIFLFNEPLIFELLF